jgi:hypothetical protein
MQAGKRPWDPSTRWIMDCGTGQAIVGVAPDGGGPVVAFSSEVSIRSGQI